MESKKRHLIVNILKQQMQLYVDGHSVQTYPVSTSSRPPSCLEGSFGTPDGRHLIAEKIGEGEPLGAVFKARQPIGKTYMELPEAQQRTNNLITTRILRLRGLEPGKNAGYDAKGRCVDSYQRYIYIHGTNQEALIGQPQSAGCILLSNADMLDLFQQVGTGTEVIIHLAD